MTKKNWSLLIILLVLSGVFGILLTRKGPTTSLEVEEELFAIQDTAAIERIELQQPDGSIQVLERQRAGWQLNDAYQADEQLMQLLLSVVHNVEVKRPVARIQQEEIVEALQQKGIQVRVYDAGGLRKEFYTGGSPEQQLSYFMQNNQPYVMELPGYATYISGIFNLSEENLRDKTLISTNYLNLQRVLVDYPQQEDVLITFDGGRLEVEGIQQPDSAQLLGFLSLFEDLQAVGYVNPQEYPELQRLLEQQPLAEITLTTLQHPQGKNLQLYGTTQDGRFSLGYLPKEEQAFLLDERLARMLLLKKEELRKGE